jgi:hypothetical protein
VCAMYLELADVAVFLHDLQELNHDLGGRADKHLAFTTTLGVGDGGKSVVQHAHENHGDCLFKTYRGCCNA